MSTPHRVRVDDGPGDDRADLVRRHRRQPGLLAELRAAVAALVGPRLRDRDPRDPHDRAAGAGGDGAGDSVG